MSDATQQLDPAAELRKAMQKYFADFHMKDGEYRGDYLERYEEAEAEFRIACRNLLPAVLDRLDAIEKERRWVPVEEELPENETLCLVASKYGAVYIAERIGNYSWSRLITVTHWQPLPAPPTPEKP